MSLNAPIGRSCHSQSQPERGEDGQSMVEMTFGVIFLALIVLVLFEMAMLFQSYIALLNASREGAVYASTHSDLPALATTHPLYVEYVDICRTEAQAAGLQTDTGHLTIDPPVLGSEDEFPQRITVTLHYQVSNPTQGIILPALGRMGLFQDAWVSARTEMPVR